ncbi:helix-turn-helix domain-containing protein [Lacticaseibacillus sharpeae]|uniref:helix-turn-helix domain-containing protein n=1 Tax=Lacticaseibacillus sharpeae TaxID=1626 RepID=UPI0007050A8E|nr:helix-turn-helix transcriptional regulator [Lacticaseibacillus sharpeae]
MSTKPFGSFIQQLRKDRGITLTEAVAGSGCSPAALSRYERGLSDISVTSMQSIITNLQLTVKDFLHHYTARTDVITKNTLYAFISGNQEYLAVNMADFMSTHAQLLHLRSINFTKFLLEVSQKSDYSAYRLTAEQEQAISDFVAPSPAWNDTQSLALVSALRFGSAELGTQLAQRLIDYAHQFTATNIRQSTISGNDFGYLIISCLINRNLTSGEPLLTALRTYYNLRVDHNLFDQISTDVINSAPLVYFSEAALAWIKQPSAMNEKKVRQVITQVQDLSLSGLTAYLERMWPLIKNGQHSWHNTKLIDNHQTPQVFDVPNWRFNYTNIKTLRKFYHLTLADVSVNWQTSTQSRFENGKSNFGFNDSLRLTEAMLMQPTVFYRALFPVPFSDFKKQASDTSIPDKYERVRQAAIATRSTFRPKPASRYKMLQAELNMRAIQMLGGGDNAKAFAEYDGANIQNLELAGILTTKHFQYSDLISFMDVAGLLDTDKQITALHWIVAHARFSIKDSSPITELVSIAVSHLAHNGDVAAIKAVQSFFENVNYNRVEAAIGCAYSRTELLIKLYTNPADAPEIKAHIMRNRQTMRQFAQPGDAYLWIGNVFDGQMDETLAAWDEWAAKRTFTDK